MVKRLMLAVAMVAVLAAPSFAAVQNVKVGGDLKTTSVIRQNFTSSGLSAAQDSQNEIVSQVGINVMADLTDNVSTTLRLVNERLWGSNAGTSTTSGLGVDMDTAYVTMKEFLYAPLTLSIGRQPLSYGNKLIIGDGDFTSNVATVSDLTGGVNFDAIKAVLSYDPLTVDLFAAKVNEDGTGLNGKDDTDLYGINANYKLGDKMSTVVEGYLFARNNKTVVTGAQEKADKLYVPGLRVSTNPIEGLNVQLEGAYQFGSDNNGTADGKDVQAYAFQGGVNYALPVLKDMKPVLSAGYTYLSGDKATNSSKTQAWDAMYEDQNTGRIFDTLGVNTNAKIANLALEVTPVQDITTKLSFYNVTLAKKGTVNQKVGNEVDLDVSYAYTEDVKFGVSAGIFYPGKRYDGTATKDNAAQLLSSVAVAF